MIAVQVLRTRWTKQSRGAEHARLRNATPDAVLLPLDVHAAELEVVTQRIAFDEAHDFALSGSSVEREPLVRTYRCDALLLRAGERSTLGVHFQWSATCGAPRRPSRRLGELAHGQWARLVYNGRSGLGEAWAYQQTTINVGLFTEAAADVFVATRPSFEHRDLADLW